MPSRFPAFPISGISAMSEPGARHGIALRKDGRFKLPGTALRVYETIQTWTYTPQVQTGGMTSVSPTHNQLTSRPDRKRDKKRNKDTFLPRRARFPKSV